jgi:hypothetical protein
MSAMAMAILLNGMNGREIKDLTMAMIASGERLNFESLGVPTTDKHSTGGVGDKITLPLAPLVAVFDVAVPQLSGRGLGHTGGTLDKLESIPGWRANLSNEEMTKQGLRVTLSKEVMSTMQGKMSMLDINRVIKPYLPNAALDDTLTQLESAVASRISTEIEQETASAGYYLRQKADMPVYTADIGKISQSELDQMHLTLGKINPRLSSVYSIYSPALLSMYKQTRSGKLQSDFIKQSFDKLDAKQID